MIYTERQAYYFKKAEIKNKESMAGAVACVTGIHFHRITSIKLFSSIMNALFDIVILSL